MSFNEARDLPGWQPAGPVAWAYGHSQAKVAVCVGPTGGGKTTESARRIVRIAQWQHPSPRDNIRKARIVCVAPTYRRIWDQVLPSYKKVMIASWGSFRGARGDPADHIFNFEFGGQKHHVEVLFRAIGDVDLEEFYRGLEATAFWYPEMDTHETGDILSLGSNRAGRYPEPDDRPDADLGLPEAYNGVYGDANAPTIGSWFHERFYLKTTARAGDRVFAQPPGFDPEQPDGFHPQAENVQNLRKISRSYYIGKAAEHEEWDVERLLKNRPGYSRHGKPVHPRFDVLRMVPTNSLEPDPSAELVIGVDAGSGTLQHAAVFLQRTWGGQVRCLAEVAPDEQTDINEFGAEVRRVYETRFKSKGVDRAYICVDPAARQQTANARGVTWAQVLQGAAQIEVQLASSQDPAVRRTALDTRLKKDVAAGQPGFIVDKSCERTIAALAGGYRFRRKGDKISPTPEKNEYSHPAEAVHYGMLGLEGMGAVAGGFIHGAGGGADTEAHAPILPD